MEVVGLVVVSGGVGVEVLGGCEVVLWVWLKNGLLLVGVDMVGLVMVWGLFLWLGIYVVGFDVEEVVCWLVGLLVSVIVVL